MFEQDEKDNSDAWILHYVAKFHFLFNSDIFKNQVLPGMTRLQEKLSQYEFEIHDKESLQIFYALLGRPASDSAKVAADSLVEAVKKEKSYVSLDQMMGKFL